MNKRLFYVFLTHTASLAGAQARAGAGAACVIAETWLKSPFFPPKLNKKQPSSLLTQVQLLPALGAVSLPEFPPHCFPS